MQKGSWGGTLYSSNIVKVNKSVILLEKKCDMHGKQEVHVELLEMLW